MCYVFKTRISTTRVRNFTRSYVFPDRRKKNLLISIDLIFFSLFEIALHLSDPMGFFFTTHANSPREKIPIAKPLKIQKNAPWIF